MNNPLRIALLFAAANLLLALLFPPYDYVSMLIGNIPTFDGFYFVFAGEPHRVINTSFLALEIIAILISACIAFLLLRTVPATQVNQSGGNRKQRVVLGLVAINLILVLLFPPFEYFSAITKAALPTFEGFYFVFGHNEMRQMVTSILYIEVALVIINGALLWLLFKDKTPDEASAEQVLALAQRVRTAQKK
ncbi:MAG: hypothetical protein A2040_11970 [Rhodocyclales bacterium GWA2_65_19]|nr:MAG: hypothetical protein A2040_11970 [Rhodocyclales bacterium GWA2_65_19]